MPKRALWLVYFIAACLVSDGARADGPPRGRLVDILKAIQNPALESCQGIFAHEAEVLESGLARIERPATLSELHTNRFTLKPLTMNDVDAAAGIYTNQQVMNMSGDYLDKYTVASIIMQGAQAIPTKHPARMINFGIWNKDGGLVGISQLAVTEPPDAAYQKGIAKPGELWFEVSYHLDPKYWGDHVAGEVTRVTTQFAFDNYGAHGIHGQTIPSNEKSGNVLKYSLKMELVHSDSYGNHYARRRDGLPIEPPAPPPAGAGGFLSEPIIQPHFEPVGRDVSGLEPLHHDDGGVVHEPFIEPLFEPMPHRVGEQPGPKPGGFEPFVEPYIPRRPSVPQVADPPAPTDVVPSQLKDIPFDKVSRNNPMQLRLIGHPNTETDDGYPVAGELRGAGIHVGSVAESHLFPPSLYIDITVVDQKQIGYLNAIVGNHAGVIKLVIPKP